MRIKTVLMGAAVALLLAGGSAQAQLFQGGSGLSGLGGLNTATTSTLRSPLGCLICAQLRGPTAIINTVRLLVFGAPPISPRCRSLFCSR